MFCYFIRFVVNSSILFNFLCSFLTCIFSCVFFQLFWFFRGGKCPLLPWFECSTHGSFGFCISKGNEKLHTRNLLTSNQLRKISKNQSNQDNNTGSCKCVRTTNFVKRNSHSKLTSNCKTLKRCSAFKNKYNCISSENRKMCKKVGHPVSSFNGNFSWDMAPHFFQGGGLNLRVYFYNIASA